MKKNDIFETVIEDMGVSGEGIGKADGLTFFIKDAVIGDTVSAKVMKLKKNYGYARLLEIKKASPFRVGPCCMFARSCGGCQIQEMSYERQLLFKAEKVRRNLIHIGKFKDKDIDAITEPVVGMEEPWHYRNKAQFPVGTDMQGRLVAGFYAGRTHKIIANLDCALGVPANEQILSAVLSYMEENQITAYNEEKRSGNVRHILTRYAFETGQIMVCLIINGTRLNNEKSLVEKLRPIKGMHSISINTNTKNTNVILGEDTRTLWGSHTIEDSLYLRDTKDFNRTQEKTIYHISPQSFYQVNPLQTEKLYSLALEYAGLTGRETVFDLYCGIGTISLFLARHARKVYGIEIVPKAIEDARKNAAENGIRNAEFFVGKAEEVLPQFAEKGCEHSDVIVVDPPRKGCDGECLSTMLKMKPERIVYISCDSATLARDLRILCDGGYELKKVRAVDQFGQTVHVETAVLLVRKP